VAEPYTREWHEERMDARLHDLAEAVEGWLDRDREDPRDSSRWAGRLQLMMRSVSAEAAAIQALDNQRYWSEQEAARARDA